MPDWMILLVVGLIIGIVCSLPSYEDRQRAKTWDYLINDIERKNKPLD